MSRFSSHALIVSLALAAAAGGFLLARGLVGPLPPTEPIVEHATMVQPPREVPEFALLDQRGQPAGRNTLRGRWQLVFFGFTYCPDVCPLTLQTLAAVRAQLDRETGTAPGVVFVSVDPERDDPQTVADYLQRFDTHFTGLTAESPAALEPLTADLGVGVQPGAPDAHGAYDVNHTSAVFLLNPEAELKAVFTGPFDTGGIARDVRRIIEAGGG